MLHYLSIVVLLLTCLQPARAQTDGSEELEDVRAALSVGDVDRLSDRSADRVDLTVFGTSELLSRAQARYVLRSFFEQYPPTRVAISDTSEADENVFASADYTHTAGEGPLTVYLRLRRTTDGWELRELRIDRSPSG